ncbi:hypothetical protein PMKS-000052 [Pichia membranifaciens]|uniref:RING-type E3 ubiquitin transferase n=1 Tax=Pichia membranifaciens TaxID=4926 RepID=A0A1Q2YAV2_9ASCO|nr:hypothetical protein PMKS-000052 [Pichia membranifaciens]
MPFIPFSSANYRSSTSSSSFDQDGSNPILIGMNTIGNNTNSNSNANGNGNSNNSSNNNSTNNSPLFQQGSFPLRRKTSVGNALFSLVSSIRQPTMSPSSNRQGPRRNSQSSHSRSRSASIPLSKQASNPGSERGHENNSSDDLNRAREEVESANPFPIGLAPELIQQFETEGISTRSNNSTPATRKCNRSDPQLTTIFSGGHAADQNGEEAEAEIEEVEGETVPMVPMALEATANSELNDYRRIGLQAMRTSGSYSSNNLNESVHNVNEASRGIDNGSSNDNTTTNANASGNANYGDSGISITNGDNSAHNMFNPAAYNYSMANSQTIPNFRIYANGGIIAGDENISASGSNSNGVGNAVIATIREDDHGMASTTDFVAPPSNNRTRGNTLRDELVQYEPVVMDSENNPTTGTVINNPITIDDSRDDVILLDAPNGPPVIISPDDHSVQVIRTPGEEHRGIDRDDREQRHRTTNGGPGNEENERGLNSAGGTETATNTMYAQTTIQQEERGQSSCDSNGFYSIRLTPSIDHSSTHPYMFFGPIVRKLKPGKGISIGRYTERSKKAATAASGSSEPVVFKSKVVSRKHAELTVDERGRWYIQDVKSSSGTFLNHVRLSLPNTESPRVFLNDSDILQLGVDYRGGSEEMYRCVKVKIELNYSWKKRAAKFSKEAHEKLKQLTNVLGGNKEELTPCVICLDDIKPCQAVFMSSCSHSWHYKCIRPLLVKTYPQFLCPNCKAVCDLEAELEDGDDDGDGSDDVRGDDDVDGGVDGVDGGAYRGRAVVDVRANAANNANGGDDYGSRGYDVMDEDLMRDVGEVAASGAAF